MRLPSGQRKLQQRRPLVLTIVLSSIMLALVAYHGRLLSALHVRQLRIRLPPGPATACSVPFEHQPYCKAIHARGCARRIAVVGNGPITEEQRTEINTQYDAVVRLNSLNNWMCNDALTVWLLETAPADSAHPYRGLQQLPLCTTTRAGAAAHHVWLVGGANSSFPTVQWSRAPVLHLDLASWRQLYMKTVSDGTPSIGWIGMMAALSCAPRVVGSVDLYGFNWRATGRDVFRHNLYAERSFADVLDGAGHVTIHATPCDQHRMCSGCIIRGFNGACLDDGAQGDIPRDALRQASQAADAEEDAEVRALTELEWLKEGERYETRQPRDVTMR